MESIPNIVKDFFDIVWQQYLVHLLDFVEQHKGFFEIFVMPVVISLLGLRWPVIQANHRRRRFRKLVRKELEEIGPENKGPQQSWKSYLGKDFVHRKIIQEPSENREFLLELDPKFVYWITQLWSAYENDQPDQWLHYLKRLSKHRYSRSADLKKAVIKWKNLIENKQGQKTEGSTDASAKWWW